MGVVVVLYTCPVAWKREVDAVGVLLPEVVVLFLCADCDDCDDLMVECCCGRCSRVVHVSGGLEA